MFPQAYRDYQQKIPRLLPSLTTIVQKEIAEYLPLKLPWLKREIGSILAVWFIVLFLGGWKDVVSEGLWSYLREAILSLNIIIVFIGLIIYLIWRTNNPQKDASNKSKSTL